MITEDSIEKAVDYLRDSAQEAAEARANVKYLTEFLKSKVAQLKGMSGATSNAAAEDVAKAHPDYLALLDGYRAAIEADARLSFLREAADARIRAWQTFSATRRAEGRAYS